MLKFLSPLRLPISPPGHVGWKAAYSTPKIRSGKTLRKAIHQIVNHEEYTVPSTIDDPGSRSENENLIKDE